MADHLLEIKDLYVTIQYDEAVVHAVNGMNLTLEKGEPLGIVGETGAGKSTTALSILKLLPPKVARLNPERSAMMALILSMQIIKPCARFAVQELP